MKTEFVNEMKEHGFTGKDATKAYEIMLSLLESKIKGLTLGKYVRLFSLFTVSKKWRKSHNIMNINTGEKELVKGKEYYKVIIKRGNNVAKEKL